MAQKHYNAQLGDSQYWAFFPVDNPNTFTDTVSRGCFGGIGNAPGRVVYISHFRCEYTEKYIPLMIRIINKITPCALVEHKGKEYISYTTVKGYDANLILLRFLKMLWDNRPSKEIQLYFLEQLANSKFNDMLAKLTTALKKTTEKFPDQTNHYLHTSIFTGVAPEVKEVKDLVDFGENANNYKLSGAPYSYATTNFIGAPSKYRKPTS